MLKEANLSLFYLTIKLYLWGQSCQFSAVWGHSECVSSKGFLSALAWTEWLTGSLLETSNHPSLFPHWPVYSKLSLVQPFSFTHHSCRRNSTDHRMLEAQWCWNTNVKHFTNADSVFSRMRATENNRSWDPDLWMNDWTDRKRNCHKSFISSHHHSVAVICCTCFVEWEETRPPLSSNLPSRWFAEKCVTGTLPKKSLL